MFMDREGAIACDQPPDDDFSRSVSVEQPVKITLTGTRAAVDRMIGLLHRCNVIGGSEWSRPVPFRNSNEVISVASRSIQVD